MGETRRESRVFPIINARSNRDQNVHTFLKLEPRKIFQNLVIIEAQRKKYLNSFVMENDFPIYTFPSSNSCNTNTQADRNLHYSDRKRIYFLIRFSVATSRKKSKSEERRRSRIIYEKKRKARDKR